MTPQNPRPVITQTEHLHPEARVFFEEVRADLHDIRTVLKGDTFGNPGMVENLKLFKGEFEEHKEENKVAFSTQGTDIQKIEKNLIRWGGILTGLFLAFQIITYLKK